MDPIVQIREPALEVDLVVLPCLAIGTRSCVPLEREKRQPEQIDADVVEERGERRAIG